MPYVEGKYDCRDFSFYHLGEQEVLGCKVLETALSAFLVDSQQ